MAYHQTERSERIRAASRHRILQAARKLFAGRGYDATTMRDVADAAGTSIGNLYFYFENKEALLLSLMAEARAPIWDWVDQVVASAPSGPVRLAVLLFANAAGLLGTDPDLTAAALLQGAPPEVVEHVAAAYRARLREQLRQGFPELSESQLDLAVTAWSGAARGLLVAKVRDDLKVTPLELAEYAARWNLRGLGVPESEIDRAVATAHQQVAARFPEAHADR